MTRSDEVLRLLVSGPLDAGSIGAAVWPNRKTRGIASQGGGDYAAQMLLGRLRKKGLVRVEIGEGSSRWELTALGRRSVK